MGPFTWYEVIEPTECFSIRSFGSFDGTKGSGAFAATDQLFQYPLFRII